VSGWNHIQTPMQVEVWEEHMAGHPGQAYCGYLMEGIWAGFYIGFQYGYVVRRSIQSI